MNWYVAVPTVAVMRLLRSTEQEFKSVVNHGCAVELAERGMIETVPFRACPCAALETAPIAMTDATAHARIRRERIDPRSQNSGRGILLLRNGPSLHR